MERQHEPRFRYRLPYLCLDYGSGGDVDCCHHASVRVEDLMTRYSITTDLSFQLLQSHEAEEHMIELKIEFYISPGMRSALQPGEPASVQILTATIIERDGIYVTKHEAPTWLWRMIEGDEALEAEMLREAWESDESARDDHADMIREERLLEERGL